MVEWLRIGAELLIGCLELDGGDGELGEDDNISGKAEVVEVICVGGGVAARRKMCIC
jgi:hypothetical protein